MAAVLYTTVTTVQKFPNLLNLRKTTSPGGFFVSETTSMRTWLSINKALKLI